MKKVNKERDHLAAIAMHGILTACSSPQYYERIRERASDYKVPNEIARMAYAQADAMIEQEKRKGRRQG